LVDWILEMPSGELRRARTQEAANGDPDRLRVLEEYLVGIEQRPWIVDAIRRRTNSVSGLSGTDRTGQRFGAWQAMNRLGQGTTGQVYEAVHDIKGAPLKGALKILHRRANTAAEQGDYRREVYALTQVIGHDNVVRLIDGDVTDDGVC